MFCVYLTSYLGSKFPPFYIGSTSIFNIENGYRGTVKSKRFKEVWKSELRSNPHLFRTQIVCKFTSEADARLKEHKLQMRLKVVKSGMYINLVYANLKFGASGENHYLFKQTLPTETRRKISISKLGKKTRPEVIQARLGKFKGANSAAFGKKQSVETKLKNAKSHFGKRHSLETKTLMSEDRKTWFWWNDGLQNKRGPTSPGANWVRGKLKRKQNG